MSRLRLVFWLGALGLMWSGLSGATCICDVLGNCNANEDSNRNANANENDNGGPNANSNQNDNAPREMTETVRYSFLDDDEGWRINGVRSGQSDVPQHSDTGGRPGGYVWVEAFNQSETFLDIPWYWEAPSTLRGNYSRAFGRRLRYEIAVTQYSQDSLNFAEVILAGGPHEIFARPVMHGYPGWIVHSVRLDETQVWRHMSDNHRATAAEIRAVLADLRQLLIRSSGARIPGGGRLSGLDEVVLELEEEPSPPRPDSVRSDFEASNEGWTEIAGRGLVDGDGIEHSQSLPLGAFEALRLSEEGNSFLRMIKGPDFQWSWDAPRQFLVDVSPERRPVLRFRWRQALRQESGTDGLVTVNLYGEARASYRRQVPANGEWQSIVIALDTEGFSGLEQLTISGEYGTIVNDFDPFDPTEWTDLDDVELEFSAP